MKLTGLSHFWQILDLLKNNFRSYILNHSTELNEILDIARKKILTIGEKGNYVKFIQGVRKCKNLVAALLKLTYLVQQELKLPCDYLPYKSEMSYLL